jgi:DNA repair ATPase RecN
VSNSEQTCRELFVTIGCEVPEEEGLSPTLLLREERSLRSKANMKMELKPIIDALKHDATQLEHHARKLRAASPKLEAEAEEIDDRVASIRKQIDILEKWE